MPWLLPVRSPAGRYGPSAARSWRCSVPAPLGSGQAERYFYTPAGWRFPHSHFRYRLRRLLRHPGLSRSWRFPGSFPGRILWTLSGNPPRKRSLSRPFPEPLHPLESWNRSTGPPRHTHPPDFLRKDLFPHPRLKEIPRLPLPSDPSASEPPIYPASCRESRTSAVLRDDPLFQIPSHCARACSGSPRPPGPRARSRPRLPAVRNGSQVVPE